MAIAINPVPLSDAALPQAAQWIEGVLLGSVGTSLAVIAVAWVGFEALNGRASPRRALQVVLGAFILFGAPQIVSSVAGLARSSSGGVSAEVPAAPLAPPPKVPPPFDPYAGASVPNAGN